MKLFRPIVAVLALSALLLGSAYGQGVRFSNHTELGVLFSGKPFFDNLAFTAQTFNGFRLNEFVSLGVTVGVDAYREITLFPLALGWRGTIPMGRVSPYLGLDVGHGFAWFENETDMEWTRGGLLFNPVVGIRVSSKGKDRFTVGLGYKRQVYTAFEGQPRLSGVLTASHSNVFLPHELVSLRKDRYTLQRIVIRLGVMF